MEKEGAGRETEKVGEEGGGGVGREIEGRRGRIEGGWYRGGAGRVEGEEGGGWWAMGD